jgi:hypothetical protein
MLAEDAIKAAVADYAKKQKTPAGAGSGAGAGASAGGATE